MDYRDNFDSNLNHNKSLLVTRYDLQQAVDGLLSGISAEQITDGIFGAVSGTEGVEFKRDKANSKSYLQSRNFVTGTTGWQITSDGDLEASSGTFRGALAGNSITIGTDAWHVDTDGNMWWGAHATYAAASIKISSAGSIDFTTGTFSGALSAASGSLGTITTADIDGGTIDGVTITGGTVRTAASGQRIVMYNNILESYDASALRMGILAHELEMYNTSGSEVGALATAGTGGNDVYLSVSGDLILRTTEQATKNVKLGLVNGGATPIITISGAVGNPTTIVGSVDIQSSLQCDSLRIDQAPTAAAIVPDSHFEISLNGTTYDIPCKATP